MKTGRSRLHIICTLLALLSLSACLSPEPVSLSDVTDQRDGGRPNAMLWLVWGSLCVAILVLSGALVLAYPDRATGALPLAIGLSALYLIVLSGSMAWYEWTLHVMYFAVADTGESFRHVSGLLGPSLEVWITPHLAGASHPLPNQTAVDGWLCAYGALFLVSLIMWCGSARHILLARLGPLKTAFIAGLTVVLAVVGVLAAQGPMAILYWVFRHTQNLIYPSYTLRAAFERFCVEGPAALIIGVLLETVVFVWALRRA